jgi:hypothetical protein
MRYGTLVAGALVVALTAGCAGTERSDSCNRTDDVEDALADLDELAEDDTNMVNVDEKLEQLGNDVHEVMNTTGDENALQPSELDLSYDDLKASIEDIGNAEDLSETGEALDDTLSQLGDAVERMSAATEEECTP